MRPNDPVLLRFQVDLDLIDREDASRWMESLRRGDTVQAAVEIKRYVLKDFRPPKMVCSSKISAGSAVVELRACSASVMLEANRPTAKACPVR